jgi:hypothetical protein
VWGTGPGRPAAHGCVAHLGERGRAAGGRDARLSGRQRGRTDESNGELANGGCLNWDGNQFSPPLRGGVWAE